MSHTKGKLSIDPLNDISIIDSSGDQLNELVCQTNGKSGEERKANAKRIVHTWNSHDDLVEQNRKLKQALMNICEEIPKPTLAVTKAIKSIAETALKNDQNK